MIFYILLIIYRVRDLNIHKLFIGFRVFIIYYYITIENKKFIVNLMELKMVDLVV